MCFELRALCLHFSVGTPPTLWLHAELHKTVWIWKRCIFDTIFRLAENILKAMYLNCAFWRYWIRYFGLKENFESKEAKWCIRTLFETYARRLFRPTWPIVATPMRHQHHHCHRNNHHTSGLRGDLSKSSSINFKLSTLGCSSKIWFHIASESTLWLIAPLCSNFSLQFQNHECRKS